MGNMELDRLLQEGIAAARAGQKEQARELLLQVIAQDEAVEAAWLWLSGVVDDPGERQICLENVLTLNPYNTAAQAGLRWLAEQGLTREAEQGVPIPPRTQIPPQPPLSPVPAPRATNGIPCSTAQRTNLTTSSGLRGKATAWGAPRSRPPSTS